MLQEPLRVLVGCDNRNCPKVAVDAAGDFVIQGDLVEAAPGLGDLPAGEGRVKVPRDLLIEFAAQLNGES